MYSVDTYRNDSWFKESPCSWSIVLDVKNPGRTQVSLPHMVLLEYSLRSEECISFWLVIPFLSFSISIAFLYSFTWPHLLWVKRDLARWDKNMCRNELIWEHHPRHRCIPWVRLNLSEATYRILNIEKRLYTYVHGPRVALSHVFVSTSWSSWITNLIEQRRFLIGYRSDQVRNCNQEMHVYWSTERETQVKSSVVYIGTYVTAISTSPRYFSASIFPWSINMPKSPKCFDPDAPGINKQVMLDWMHINHPMTPIKSGSSRDEVAKKVKEVQPQRMLSNSFSHRAAALSLDISSSKDRIFYA